MNSGEWFETTIGDQVLLQRGYDITKAEQRGGIVPVISSSGVTSYHDTAKMKGPGVVLGRKGVVGSVHFVEADYWPHDTTLFVKDFKGNCPRFVYYFFKSMSEVLASMDVGSANPTLNRNHINPISVQWPPVSEQNLIAATLSCLDDMIELNNRTNQILEEIAQAIFKRWFIDFEFPNEEGLPYRSSGGETVDSELGEIPKGWVVGKAEQYFDISIGKTPPRKEPQWFTEPPKGIKWISITDMGNNGVFIMDTSESLVKAAVDKFNIKTVPPYTVLLSFKLTIGRVGITNEEMTTNEAIARFETNDQVLKEYLYFYLKHFDYASLGSTSSIATAINSKIVKAMPFIQPPREILEKYHDAVFPIFLEIQHNQMINGELNGIRDTLLPKLISGEIRVPPIEEVG